MRHPAFSLTAQLIFPLSSFSSYCLPGVQVPPFYSHLGCPHSPSPFLQRLIKLHLSLSKNLTLPSLSQPPLHRDLSSEGTAYAREHVQAHCNFQQTFNLNIKSPTQSLNPAFTETENFLGETVHQPSQPSWQNQRDHPVRQKKNENSVFNIIYSKLTVCISHHIFLNCSSGKYKLQKYRTQYSKYIEHVVSLFFFFFQSIVQWNISFSKPGFGLFGKCC